MLVMHLYPPFFSPILCHHQNKVMLSEPSPERWHTLTLQCVRRQRGGESIQKIREQFLLVQFDSLLYNIRQILMDLLSACRFSVMHHFNLVGLLFCTQIYTNPVEQIFVLLFYIMSYIFSHKLC